MVGLFSSRIAIITSLSKSRSDGQFDTAIAPSAQPDGLDLNAETLSPRWGGWNVFQGFGLTVGVRVNEPDILEPLNNHLPPGCRFDNNRRAGLLYSFYVNRGQALRGIRRFHTLYRNSAILLRSEDENDLYD